MSRRFVIDALPESAARYGSGYVVVAVDVFRATTTIVTALAKGRPVYAAADEASARALASCMPDAVLAGELSGLLPDGFLMNNSPAAVASSDDPRLIILVSSAGTRLLSEARAADTVLIACLRNLSATARWLSSVNKAVALIGAGARGLPRPEDSLACAWLADRLLRSGFVAADAASADHLERWREVQIPSLRQGPSADFLRASGQDRDIDFVTEHIDDLDLVAIYDGSQARVAQSEPVV